MAAVFFLTTPSDRLRGVSPSEVGLRHGQMSKIKTDDLRRERKNRDGRSGGWVGKRMSGWGVGGGRERQENRPPLSSSCHLYCLMAPLLWDCPKEGH